MSRYKKVDFGRQWYKKHFSVPAAARKSRVFPPTGRKTHFGPWSLFFDATTPSGQSKKNRACSAAWFFFYWAFVVTFFFFFFFFISTTQGVTREILHSLKRQLYLEPKINAKCYEEKTTNPILDS